MKGLRPRLPPVPVTEPPETVLGYVVVRPGDRPALTHATLLERDDADWEAKRWHEIGNRAYRVCAVVAL